MDALFWKKVTKTADCWLWTGAVNSRGYGSLSRGGGRFTAHRFAYLGLVGPVPDGLDLDHLCRNRLCVNPAHLEPVSRRTNILRGVGPSARNAVKTVCDSGHPFSEANTYLHRGGKRICRACNRAAVARYKARKRAS